MNGPTLSRGLRPAVRTGLSRAPISPRRRLLHTTTTRCASAISKALVVPNKQAARPDFLQRIPDRPLPSNKSLSNTRRWVRTLPLFVIICTASALGIFNYQKVNSPIISATLYSLRTNPRVRDELGDEVYFASQWAWIWGPINLVQGNVDVSFRVKGKKAAGLCRFKAKRQGGRNGFFKTDEWSLTMDSGICLQLLEEENPAAGKGPLKEKLF